MFAKEFIKIHDHYISLDNITAVMRCDKEKYQMFLKTPLSVDEYGDKRVTSMDITVDEAEILMGYCSVRDITEEKKDNK